LPVVQFIQNILKNVQFFTISVCFYHHHHHHSVLACYRPTAPGKHWNKEIEFNWIIIIIILYILNDILL
jgi:hypothetical protein